MRKNLKEARQAAELTQQAMADKLGISLVYYQKIEQGSRTEDITGVHQRKLREIEETHHAPKASL